ncbi:hypothetical protein DSECCO2_473150 [anaerobic digester metagenome]
MIRGAVWIEFMKLISKTNLVMAMAVLLALAGTFLNVLKEPVCFFLWMGSNLVFMVSAWKDCNRWMCFVFLCYLSMSVWGLVTW